MKNNNKIHVFYYDDITAEARDLEIDNNEDTITALLGPKHNYSIRFDEISLGGENFLIAYSDDPFVTRNRSITVFRNNRPYVYGRYMIMRLCNKGRCSLNKFDLEFIPTQLQSDYIYCAKKKKIINKIGLVLKVEDKNINQIEIGPITKDGKVLYN